MMWSMPALRKAHVSSKSAVSGGIFEETLAVDMTADSEEANVQRTLDSKWS